MGRERGPRRVSVTVAVGACVLAAVAAWVGGRWLADRQAAQRASPQVAVELVLQSASLYHQTTTSPPTWVASVRGILVNSGPTPVVVQSIDWAGAGSGGPFTVKPYGASPALTLLATVDCHPTGSTRVPLPVAGIRVRTPGGTVIDQRPVVLNPEVWDQAVEQSCTSGPTPTSAG